MDFERYRKPGSCLNPESGSQMDPENHENLDVQEAILAPAYNLLFLNTCLLVAS